MHVVFFCIIASCIINTNVSCSSESLKITTMKKTSAKFWTTIIFACVIGFALAKIDTSKNWNDTGITVGLVLISSFIFGVIMPRLAWLWAIIIGGFIFSFNAIQNNNYGSAGAILFAFVGAYSGVLLKKFFFNSTIK